MGGDKLEDLLGQHAHRGEVVAGRAEFAQRRVAHEQNWVQQVGKAELLRWDAVVAGGAAMTDKHASEEEDGLLVLGNRCGLHGVKGAVLLDARHAPLQEGGQLLSTKVCRLELLLLGQTLPGAAVVVGGPGDVGQIVGICVHLVGRLRCGSRRGGTDIATVDNVALVIRVLLVVRVGNRDNSPVLLCNGVLVFCLRLLWRRAQRVFAEMTRGRKRHAGGDILRYSGGKSKLPDSEVKTGRRVPEQAIYVVAGRHSDNPWPAAPAASFETAACRLRTQTLSWCVRLPPPVHFGWLSRKS